MNALRAAEALTISLVAEVDNKLVGHIAFSPLTISDGTAHWYGLGPLAVLPAYQRQGIGKALMQQGLADLKANAAQGCAWWVIPIIIRNLALKQYALKLYMHTTGLFLYIAIYCNCSAGHCYLPRRIWSNPLMQRRDFLSLISMLLLSSLPSVEAKDNAAMSSKKRIIVIGAGLAGLAAAKTLQAQGHEAHCVRSA